uniref:SCP domain-containing protein n=1 Tax=Timema douglasi TaxID=61478 RepID=A0A7R8VG89_TIMDO|nr:unnamed protein product [Timema douglasi]
MSQCLLGYIRDNVETEKSPRYSVAGSSNNCNEGVAAACNTPFYRGFNQTEKDDIVNEHNRLRNIVALGKESRGNPGPQPSAANMNKIVMYFRISGKLGSWDDELAGIAQRWVDQCQIDHDSCRRCERFNVGQNICMSGSTIHHSFDPSSQVKAFYDEVKYFNRTDVNCFNIPEPNSEVVGHYTQVVWADTTLVGCGLIYYPDGVWNIYYMACNYGPAGNIIGDSLYKEGTPCSECAGGCDITYTGLCAHDNRRLQMATLQDVKVSAVYTWGVGKPLKPTQASPSPPLLIHTIVPAYSSPMASLVLTDSWQP